MLQFLTQTASVNDKLVSAIQGLDLTVVMDGVLAVIPVALPVLVSLIGVRKGISFLRSTVSGC